MNCITKTRIPEDEGMLQWASLLLKKWMNPSETVNMPRQLTRFSLCLYPQFHNVLKYQNVKLATVAKALYYHENTEKKAGDDKQREKTEGTKR